MHYIHGLNMADLHRLIGMYTPAFCGAPAFAGPLGFSLVSLMDNATLYLDDTSVFSGGVENNCLIFFP